MKTGPSIIPAAEAPSASASKGTLVPRTKARTLKRKQKGGRRMGVKGTVRITSLWAALGDDAKREQVCDWLFAKNLSNKDVTKLIKEHLGLHTSDRAVDYFRFQYSFPWNVQRPSGRPRSRRASCRPIGMREFVRPWRSGALWRYLKN